MRKHTQVLEWCREHSQHPIHVNEYDVHPHFGLYSGKYPQHWDSPQAAEGHFTSPRAETYCAVSLPHPGIHNSPQLINDTR